MKAPFSKWCRWSERDNVLSEDLRSIGVYLIAQDLKIRCRANPLYRHIIYIGETTDSLRKRLNAFEAASKDYYKGSHAGGQSLFKDKIFPDFAQIKDKLRADRGKEEVSKEMGHLIEKSRGECEGKWASIEKGLWVAIWTPSYGIEGQYEKLPPEYRPKVLEVSLQAKFYLRNGRLPRYNKQIG